MNSIQPIDYGVSLPECGSVLGVDIGYSEIRRSGSVCRLDWDKEAVRWSIERFKAREPERSSVISEISRTGRLLAASFDGPLRGSLDVIGQYRVAERMLTRRLRPLIGKPGQSNTPVGTKLNINANVCTKLLLSCSNLELANHSIAIHQFAISEAFPSTFLGLMISDPTSLGARRRNRSDTFYVHLTSVGTLDRLLRFLLGERRIESPFASVKNHDDRAALVCALTALCIAGHEFTAVGDKNGWIILPPIHFIQAWGRTALEANNCEEQSASFHVSGSRSTEASGKPALDQDRSPSI